MATNNAQISDYYKLQRSAQRYMSKNGRTEQNIKQPVYELLLVEVAPLSVIVDVINVS